MNKKINIIIMCIVAVAAIVVIVAGINYLNKDSITTDCMSKGLPESFCKSLTRDDWRIFQTKYNELNAEEKQRAFELLQRIERMK